jgi:hypothetical protein
MRVRVTGGNHAAAGELKSLLSDKRVGYTVTEIWPRFTVYLEHDTSVSVDGVHSDLESRIVDCIAELVPEPILLKRQGGIRSEQEIRIGVPDKHSAQVVLGVLRGLMKVGNHGQRSKWGLF